MKAKALGLFLAALACGGPLVAEPPVYRYTAAEGKLPQDATPRWARRHAGGNFKIEDSRLVAEILGGTRGFFVIGRSNTEEEFGQVDAWQGKLGEATVDFC